MTKQGPAKFVLTIAALSLTGIVTAEPLVDVDTDAGPVQGELDETNAVTRFLGIPYAAPPVDDLRWKAPAPVEAWSRTLKRDQFASRCFPGDSGRDIRGRVSYRNPVYVERSQPLSADEMNVSQRWALPNRDALVIVERVAEPSEDCLYLNVWTAAESSDEALPVMVWIYGDNFASNAAADPRFSGEHLASAGIVVVTFDYRLGALGFLAHPALSAESPSGVSGNYGLLDSIAALQWVQRNIKAFGGDPDRVTAVGSGSGAAMVSALMASAEGPGLFSAAILQGNGASAVGLTPMTTLAEAERRGSEILQRLTEERASTAKFLEELRDVDPEDLAPIGVDGLVVDGEFIPEDPSIVFAEGRQMRIPILTGFNRDEPGGQQLETVSRYREQAAERFGDLAETFLALYPVESVGDVIDTKREAARDEAKWRTALMARQQAQLGVDSYVYEFTGVPEAGPGTRSDLPVAEAEMPYLFRNMDPREGFGELHQHLAEIMSRYWMAFMRTGAPQIPGGGWPDWPAYAAGSAAMEIGASVGQMQTPLGAEKAGFFDSVFEAHVARLAGQSRSR